MSLAFGRTELVRTPLPDSITPEVQAVLAQAHQDALDHMALLDRVAMMDQAWPPAWSDWSMPEIKYTPRDPRGVWGGFILFHKAAR